MNIIYNQAIFCSPGCCPIVSESSDGKLAISDPSFPAQGTFTFKDEAEAETFFANAPRAFAEWKASKKT